MKRRLEWKIYHEGDGVGVIVTDLDAKTFAVASHRFEWVARRHALHRLAHQPSGGKRRERNPIGD